MSVLHKPQVFPKNGSRNCMDEGSVKCKDVFASSCLLPQRVSCNQRSAVLVQHVRAPEQAQGSSSPSKIDVTIKSPVGDISVVTLIRTDTTLDHSQTAEKV